MGTCKTCRWWNAPDLDYRPRCSILTDYKHMQRRLGVADVLADEKHAWAEDADTFYCGPDFGCVHHQLDHNEDPSDGFDWEGREP